MANEIKNPETEAKAKAIAKLALTDKAAASEQFKEFVNASTMVRWEVLAFQDRVLFLIKADE